MDRPKSANWMIPLMVTYGVISASFVLLLLLLWVNGDTNILYGITLFLPSILWMLLFWCGLEIMHAKPRAHKKGQYVAGTLLLGTIVGGLGYFDIPIISTLSPSTYKMVCLMYGLQVLQTYFTVPQMVLVFLYIGIWIADILVLISILLFCRNPALAAWIDSANKPSEES